MSTNAFTTEWYAFFWAAAQTTNYVTYIPRIHNGQAYHVPEQMSVDYHSCSDFVNGIGCSWVTAKTVTLAEQLDPAGYTIFLDTPVVTNGIRLLSQKMRRDPSGAEHYYFQIAELYAGNGQTEPATKHLTFTYGQSNPVNPISCDVYGYSKKKVLDNSSAQIAYDFNVTQVSGSEFVAVYHSEPYKSVPLIQVGDATSVSTSSAPDGPFPRTNDDYIVTRTSNASQFMQSLEYPGSGDHLHREVSGGGNPILIRRGGPSATYDYKWTLFYVSVSDVAQDEVTHDNFWRHYLHVAHPGPDDGAVMNMKNATWASLARSGTTDLWQPFTPRLKYLSYEPWPARNWSATNPSIHNKILESDYKAFNDVNTQGLIGNATYNSDKSKVFLFTLENLTNPITVRREMFNIHTPNYWLADSKETVLDQYAFKTAYVNEFGGHYVVLISCPATAKAEDICLDFTAGGSDATSQFSTIDTSAHALGLAPFFDDAAADFKVPPGQPAVLADGGVMEQFGILKNPWGQLQFAPDGTTYVYITERVRPTGLWGMDMYSVKMRCSQ